MIECINNILDILIKTASLVGLFFIFYKYLEIRNIDNKINSIEEKYRNKVNNLEDPTKVNSTEMVFLGENVLLNKKENIIKNKEIEIEPLYRKRRNIISIIPFLK